jgi:hypothetical protein
MAHLVTATLRNARQKGEHLRLVVDYEEAPWPVNHGRIPLTDVARKAMTSVF